MTRSTTRTIPIGARGQHAVVVDQEDYAYLMQWRWSFKTSRWRQRLSKAILEHSPVPERLRRTPGANPNSGEVFGPTNLAQDVFAGVLGIAY